VRLGAGTAVPCPYNSKIRPSGLGVPRVCLRQAEATPLQLGDHKSSQFLERCIVSACFVRGIKLGSR
jgi:hypothetical protein